MSPSVDAGLSDATSSHQPDTGVTTPDAAKPDTGTGITDSGTPDSGPQGTLTAAVFNNLIPVEDSIQICFAASATGMPGIKDALPTQPTSAVAPGTTATVTLPNVVGENVRFFVYYTKAIAGAQETTASCQTLISQSTVTDDSYDGGEPDGGTGTFVEGVDFDTDVVPAFAFAAPSKYLIMPTGCPYNSSVNDNTGDFEGYCGDDPLDGSTSGYPYSYGDFHVRVAALSAAGATAPNNLVQGVNAIGRYDYYTAEGPAYPDYLQGFNNIGIGVGYPDAGGTESYVYLNGPAPQSASPDYAAADAGLTFFTFPTDSGALPPGTVVPALSTASNVTYFTTHTHDVTIANALAASGLTMADLVPGASYTIITYGDSGEVFSLADGGPNPLRGFVIIRNDVP